MSYFSICKMGDHTLPKRVSLTTDTKEKAILPVDEHVGISKCNILF